MISRFALVCGFCSGLLNLASAQAQEPCQIRIQGLSHAVVFADGVRALLRSEDACAPKLGATYELHEPKLLIEVPSPQGMRQHQYEGLRGTLSSDRSLLFIAGDSTSAVFVDLSHKELKSRNGVFFKLRAGEEPKVFRAAR